MLCDQSRNSSRYLACRSQVGYRPRGLKPDGGILKLDVAPRSTSTDRHRFPISLDLWIFFILTIPYFPPCTYSLCVFDQVSETTLSSASSLERCYLHHCGGHSASGSQSYQVDIRHSRATAQHARLAVQDPFSRPPRGMPSIRLKARPSISAMHLNSNLYALLLPSRSAPPNRPRPIAEPANSCDAYSKPSSSGA